MCSVAFGVVWLFAVFLQWNRDGSWTMYRSLTSSFLWSTTNGGHLYALISSFTGSMQHATERVERPGESQEALDGKNTWYSAERSVTLHSFDFTKYRLWTSLFRRGTIVNGQIVVCSFDLTEYHLWKIYFWMFFRCSMKHRSFYDTQRAQPTLRLHSSRFVVESCDVSVGNRTLFEQFGNISTV